MPKETTPSVAEQADERAAFEALLHYAEGTVCVHETTHRGGAIWTICDDCDMKWADDEGGMPAFAWPKEISAARAALAASQAASHSAPEPAEDALCPRCDGEGTIVVMSDGGPDAYEVPVDCPHCSGKQTLYAAYHGTVELLEQSEAKYQKAASILYLGRANPSASKRLAELAEYVMQPGMQADWLRARLLDLSDMARVSAPPAPLSAESKACASVAWENFPAYLIDHCEGDTITEEGLQHALARMLKDPQYAAVGASVQPVQASLSDAERVLALLDGGGWELYRSIPWDALTDEANERNAWFVKRNAAPYCDKEGFRQWAGPTAIAAFTDAIQKLGIPTGLASSAPTKGGQTS